MSKKKKAPAKKPAKKPATGAASRGWDDCATKPGRVDVYGRRDGS